MDMLPIEINAGVYASFASSICTVASNDGNKIALFEDDQSQLYRDWKKAYLNMTQVISQWQATWECPNQIYPKHRFIVGKLLYFAAYCNWNELYRENILGESVTREAIVVNALKCFSELQRQDAMTAYKTSSLPEYQKWTNLCFDLLDQFRDSCHAEGRQDYVNV